MGTVAALIAIMHDVQSIDPTVLATVQGGAPGARPAQPPPHPASPPSQPHPAANHVGITGNLGVTARGVQVGLQGGVQLDSTNYARCMDRSDRGNWTPDQTLR